MSGSPDIPLWSNNPNAPKIEYYDYLGEKSVFAGTLIGSILYGILIVVFFQCMAALFNPAHRKREGIKWGFVSYTVAMFSSVTVFTAMNLNIQSLSFIDNREYAVGGTLLGPYEYQIDHFSKMGGVGLNLLFLLNYWLADGLLLYRCYVIYSKNRWAIAFPCFMYLGTVAMGIMTLGPMGLGQQGSFWITVDSIFGFPYLLISISLNILLTLMIVIRLILHGRSIRAVMGTPGGIGGLYKTIITMLVESSMLYATCSLTVAVLMIIGPHIVGAFLPILTETQVIAPLLIIQRVANQSALTSRTIVTGHTSSLNFRSRGRSMGDYDTPPAQGGDHTSPADKRGETHGEPGAAIEIMVDFHQDDA